MTMDEFFAILPKDGWYLDLQNQIRNSHEGCTTCPITHVTNTTTSRQYKEQEFKDAGALLGLKSQDVWDIVYAADDLNACDPELRSKLLQYCGLEEEDDNA